MAMMKHATMSEIEYLWNRGYSFGEIANKTGVSLLTVIGILSDGELFDKAEKTPLSQLYSEFGGIRHDA